MQLGLGDGSGEQRKVNSPRACSSCGSTNLDPGFIEDGGDHSRGYARWIAGRLERGPFGGARRMGKQRWEIEAYRCAQCGHLDLWVHNPV